MTTEVRIISNRMIGEKWRKYEQDVARYLTEGWRVIGFAVERDMEYGDLAYTMLARDTPESSNAPDHNERAE